MGQLWRCNYPHLPTVQTQGRKGEGAAPHRTRRKCVGKNEFAKTITPSRLVGLSSPVLGTVGAPGLSGQLMCQVRKLLGFILHATIVEPPKCPPRKYMRILRRGVRGILRFDLPHVSFPTPSPSAVLPASASLCPPLPCIPSLFLRCRPTSVSSSPFSLHRLFSTSPTSFPSHPRSNLRMDMIKFESKIALHCVAVHLP